MKFWRKKILGQKLNIFEKKLTIERYFLKVKIQRKS